MEVTKDCNQVFNLAADMGGMGFIESNQSVLLFNNTMLSFNMLEVGRCASLLRTRTPTRENRSKKITLLLS